MNKKIFIVLSILIIILIGIGILVWVFLLKPEKEKPPIIESPIIQELPSCFDLSKDPVPICNCQDLQMMSENLAGNYKLENNINCLDTKNWNDGKGFLPIGYNIVSADSGFKKDRFVGKFDGQNYVIKNLFINMPKEDFIGLFGYIYGGEIKNIGLENINISSQSIAGGLAGENHNGAISNCYTTGVISGNDDIGGLVGFNQGDSIIRESYAAVTVFNSHNDVGGLAGENEGLIENCYATGNVSGDKDAGGLVGESNGIDDNGNLHIGTIKNCYATGGVAGSENAGGLVSNTHGGIIMNSYATGTVSSNKDAGGFIGDNHNSEVKNCFSTGGVSGVDRVGGFNGVNHGGKITNCYWNKPAGISLGCVGRNKEEGIVDCYTIDNNVSYFYSFANKPMNLWEVPAWSKKNEGKGYPFLAWQKEIPQVEPFPSPQPTPSPTPTPTPTSSPTPTPTPTSSPTPTPASACFNITTDPILICNCEQLQRMKENLSANYKLQNNIDCSDTKNWNNGKGFEPVGYDIDPSALDFQGNKFIGSFDGQKYTISNLFIKRPNEDFIGLFGCPKGKIKNIVLKEVSLSGYIGVGGLVGQNEGEITSSYTTGNVSGNENVGGLAGENTGNGNITNSYSLVTINNSTKDVGGLVGENEAPITNCYAVGNISGSNNIGGLVGHNDVGGTITNSFASGIVSGLKDIGGLVGDNEAVATNSYWDKPAGSSLSCVGHIKGGTAECQTIQNNKSYFYDVDNLPMSIWKFPPWSRQNDEKNFPILE